jgi:hypothetical protein
MRVQLLGYQAGQFDRLDHERDRHDRPLNVRL